MRRFTVTSVCVLSLLLATSGATQPTPPGTRVGAIVTDAITTAAANAPVKSRPASLAAAATKLKALTSVNRELAAVTQFLDAAAPAAIRCAKFMTAVEAAPPSAQLSVEWKDCGAQLAAMMAVPSETLNAVEDVQLRQQFLDVQTVASEGTTAIVQSMARGNWPEVRARVAALNQSLIGILATSTVEVGRFKAATDALLGWSDNPERDTAAARTSASERTRMQEARRSLDEARKGIAVVR
jgi:hypothetical protein